MVTRSCYLNSEDDLCSSAKSLVYINQSEVCQKRSQEQFQLQDYKVQILE